MSGMLAKVMNSTVGTSNFRSLDEAIADKVHDKLSSSVRFIGSDNVLCHYTGTWSTKNGEPTSSYEGFSTQEITFSHSGVVIFKTTQTANEEPWTMYVRDVNTNADVGKSTPAYDDLSVGVSFDMTVLATVEAGKPYIVIISNKDAPAERQMNLTICATPVMFAPTVTIV